jgi:hypothetical protein
MDLVQFKGSFVDMARPTLFRVQGFGIGRQLEFMCKGAQLPGSTIGQIEVPYAGRKIKIAGDRIYPEWTITVMNDTSFGVKNDFEDWMAFINDPTLNIGIPAVEGYKRDGFVEQLDNAGLTIERYDIKGAFPIEISPVEVSAEANDTISEFTVSIAFDYWTRA